METHTNSCGPLQSGRARGPQDRAKPEQSGNIGGHASQFDPRDLALPFIADHLAAASCFAASGASLANVGDVNGLAYAVQKAIAHLKAAAATTRDLLDQTSGQVTSGESSHA